MFLRQVWPVFKAEYEPYLRRTINDALAGVRPSALRRLELESFTLGEYAPQVQGITYHCPAHDSFMLDLDILLGGDIDAVLVVGAAGMNAPVRLDDLVLRGTLRIQFEPLVALTPWFKNIKLSFVRAPDIDFDLAAFTKMLNLMAVPGVSGMVANAIKYDALSFMVFPQTLNIEIISDADLKRAGLPVPRGAGSSAQSNQPGAGEEDSGQVSVAATLGQGLAGVLAMRVAMVEVDLPKLQARQQLAGSRSGSSADPDEWSDLLVDIAVGDESRSSVLFPPNEALAPQHSAPYHFIVPSSVFVDYITVSVQRRRKRMARKDRMQSVGEVRLPVAAVLTPDGLSALDAGTKPCRTQHTLTLPDVPEVTVHVVIDYRPFGASSSTMPSAAGGPTPSADMPLPSPGSTVRDASALVDTSEMHTLRGHLALKEKFDQVEAIVPDTPSARGASGEGGGAVISQRGVLLVRAERAADLRNADTIGLSDPYAVVRVGQQRHATKRINNCLNPEWNEEFQFFVDNSATANIFVAVMDHDATSSDDPLGDLSLSVAEVQASEEGRLRGEWPLEHTPQGRITLALVWKPY